MLKKIIILGGGMVGSAIARDLRELNYSVTVADIDESIQKHLAQYKINYLKLDVADFNSLKDALKNFDLVIGAVPGFIGYKVLETVLTAQKNVVDISFMPEDSKKLFDFAVQNGVTAITDAGIAPGLSNLIFGKVFVEFDSVLSAKCFVGGLPQKPKPPWLYKSVFSPIDVIEEYTRPARLVENGQIISKPAMTDIEQIKFNQVGILDAFNSDGLRSLLDLPIPNMVEKTLRFPGHVQKIIEMRNNGCFESDKIRKTTDDLIEEWAPKSEYYDQTILRLQFEGVKDGEVIIETYDLFDYYDNNKNISSMARTTGYTCNAVANILLFNTFTKKGIFNLESLGSDVNIVNEILNYLDKRNVQFVYYNNKG